MVCNIENDVLQTMINYLLDNKIINNNLVLIFDGLMILKKNVKDLNKLMNELIMRLKIN